MKSSSHPAIHQFSPTASYGDAVTNGMLLTQELLRGLGFASEIWVLRADPRVAAGVRDVRNYPRREGDVLLVHHSLGHDDLIPWLASLPDRKLLVYHNITPPEFFADDAHLRRLASLGREQLHALRGAVDGVFTESDFNAEELEAVGYERVIVLPILLDSDRTASAPFNAEIVARNADVFTMLFVGRIERNKCQHDVIDVFRRVRRRLRRPSQCVLVGRFDPRVSYVHELRLLAARLGVADRVRLLGLVSDEDLRGWYRAADVFVSMSEHEGFGVPLIEAMAHGVPVVAHESSNVRSTLAGAGVLVQGKPLDEVAALVCEIEEQPEPRRRIVARQRARAADFSLPVLRERLADALRTLGVGIPQQAGLAVERCVEARRVHAGGDGGLALAPWEESDAERARMNKSRMEVPEGELDELRRRARQAADRERPVVPIAEVKRTEPVAAGWAAAHRAIEQSERYVEVGDQLPPMTQLMGWRRRLAIPVARLILRAAKLVTRDQRSFNVESTLALRAVASAASAQANEIEQRLAELRTAHDDALARLAAEAARHHENLEARLEAVQRAVAEAAAAAEQRAVALEQAAGAARAEAAANLAAIAQQLRDDGARLQAQLTSQERSLRVALEGGGAAPGDAAAAEERGHLLDDFYVAFEDRFRGSRDEIKTRVTAYLPIVREASAGTAERPLVDLGCGRGEWLEVLAAEGLHARGVDSNRIMVEDNRRHGRDVVEGDALAYLRRLPDASCGAVSALHLLEHLPFETLVAVLDEIVRVLQPGGVAILETPNPQNLLVGACSFYVDPTHRNPLHPATLAFVAETRGLARVEVRYLHPAAERFHLPDDEGSALAKPLNEYLFGPMDFAVIGYRA